MPTFSPYNQTLFVVWLNQILFWSTTTILLFNGFPLWFIPLIMCSWYLFGAISEISVHRFLTHKAFKTTERKGRLLAWMATLVGQGPVLSWVAVHRHHHAFEDTSRDPHSPHFIPKWRLILGLFPKNEYKIGVIADLLRSKNKPYFVFENKWYWLMWIALWTSSALLNFYVFYFLVSGSALWYLCTQLVNIVCHGTVGQKDYPNAVGLNNSLINAITGAGHHNNHHAFPASHTYKQRDDQTDIYAWLIDKLFKTEN